MNTAGGIQTLLEIQYIYLDFDGETTVYNGELLTVDRVELTDSLLSREEICDITAALNDRYSGSNVIFVTERPVGIAFSTVYVGYTGDLGNVRGLAETIDRGNRIADDNAFVILDGTESVEQIAGVIAHETDHIVFGLEHEGNALERYAARYDVESGISSTGIELRHDSMFVSGGGVANNTVVNNEGWLFVSGGAVVNNTTVNSRGNMLISGGAVANNTVIHSQGQMKIIDDGVANHTTIGNEGWLFVSGGGIANDTIVNYGGLLYVFKGGTVSIVFNPWGGSIASEAGATVIHLEREADCYFGGARAGVVSKAAGFDQLEIASGYGAVIYSGGSASRTTVRSGGSLVISGGIHRGTLAVEQGGSVAVSGGGIIDFSLSDRSAADDYVINNLSAVTGAPVYSITVSATQEVGTYRLAQGAAGFTNTVTVGDGTAAYGSLTVGGAEFRLLGKSYSLTRSGSDLCLDIKASSGGYPIVSLSTEEWTNRDVSVTLEYDPESGKNEYSLDGGNSWLLYDGAFTVTEKTELRFRSTYSNGMVIYTEHLVGNIDKTAPTIGDISADIKVMTNQNITVSAVFADDCFLASKQYKIGNGKWSDYVAGVTMTANETIYFRATDAAGNEGTAQFTVDNIDKTAPDKPLVSADITAATNKNVEVGATCKQDAGSPVFIQYSLDGKSFREYTTSVTVRENGTLYFRCADTAGNIGSSVAYTVSNIDRTPPALPVISVTTADNGGKSEVIVSAAFSKDSAIREYSVNGTDWESYLDPVKCSAGETVSFRAFDAAGNASDIVSWNTLLNLDDSWALLRQRNSPATDIGFGAEYSDWVGSGDKIDFRHLVLTRSGSYNFTVSGLVNTVKATVYEVIANVKTGLESLKKIKSVSIKPAGGAITGVLLDAGKTYCVSVEAPGAAKGLGTVYDFKFGGTEFTRANEAADGIWSSAPALAFGERLSEWVGFGDKLDYRRLALTESGSYDFTISGVENTVKMTVYEVVANTKLKKLKSISVKSTGGAITGLLLDGSKSYCVSVEAAGAAKGLNTGYDLAFGGTLFDNAGNGIANDSWGDAGVGVLDLAAGVAGEWVGFGDAVDFFKFGIELEQAGSYGFNLNLEHEKHAVMTVYKVTLDKKGKEVLTAVKAGKDGLFLFGEGDYALKVASADKGKGKKNSGYGISVELPGQDSRGSQGTLAG